MGAKPLCNQACQHIAFITFRGSNDNIRFVNTCFKQDFSIGAVAFQTYDIQRTRTAFNDRVVLVDTGDVMLLLRQMLREGVSDLSGTDHNDPHKKPPN